jgi:hypothetical protein
MGSSIYDVRFKQIKILERWWQFLFINPGLRQMAQVMITEFLEELSVQQA